MPNNPNLPISVEMPDEAETASEVNTPMKKRVRIESSSTEEQGEMEHVEKLPVPEKNAKSPRNYVTDSPIKLLLPLSYFLPISARTLTVFVQDFEIILKKTICTI